MRGDPGLAKLIDPDEMKWTLACHVAKHDGDTDHYAYSSNGQIELSVVTNKTHVPIKALLKGGDANQTGIWFIPAIGTEVMVAFDDGEFEGDAYVVAVHGSAPGSLSPGTVLVIGDSIEIRSSSGTAKRLMTVDDGTALKNAIAGATVTPNDGGASLKATILAGLPSSLGLNWPVGTQKGKVE